MEKEKQEQKMWLQKNRQMSKISNMIKRHNIDTSCVICSQPGKIVHNVIYPYVVTFLCPDCKKSNKNIIKAWQLSTNVKKLVSRQNLNNMKDQPIKYMSENDLKLIIDEYLDQNSTIGEFCKDKNISRYQFTKMINTYKRLNPKSNAEVLVKSKSRKIQRDIIITAKGLSN